MAAFRYPCPECRSRSNIHDDDCPHAGTDRATVEGAYLDIAERLAVAHSAPVAPTDLAEGVDGWGGLHEDCLDRLRTECRVGERDGGLRFLTPEERRDELAEPDFDPVRTVYERGSVPGCHDNAVFAMIAYYEMVGLSWRETRERVVEWLRESGSWGRGGFEESSPEALVDQKRHVYEEGYGWREKAAAAKRVIDERLGSR